MNARDNLFEVHVYNSAHPKYRIGTGEISSNDLYHELQFIFNYDSTYKPYIID